MEDPDVSAPIRSADGTEIGKLIIRSLPSTRSGRETLKVLETDSGTDPTPQLLEDCEYWYRVDLLTPRKCRTDRDDIFIWDPTESTGHLRPGSHVGFLPVAILAGSTTVGTVELEVRSRKLGYLDDYRTMLHDIAATSAVLLMEQFGVTQQRFKAEGIAGYTTPYNRFEFLKSVVSPEALGAAIEEVRRRPHHTWLQDLQPAASARGIPSGHSHLRDLLMPGPRVPWPASSVPNLRSVPRNLPVRRSHATYDTLPNRFIKFALKRWRSEIANLQNACAAELTGPPRARALKETSEVLDWLDFALAWPVLAEVSELEQFPYTNTVLLRREGYRELFEAFGLFELVAELAWEGGEFVFRAGQRDAAALYEYWCFLQLASLVTELCGGKSERSLVAVDTDGARLDLRRGRESVVSGSIVRLGRTIDLALYFNRAFSIGPSGDQSWTRAMRPDCSLRIASADDEEDESVWIHFDAKYKIETSDQIFTDILGEPAGASQVERAPVARAKRDDLLKMHAYRDAIRQSAGSYVLYPGPPNEHAQRFRRFHEILPGIGAFALTPSQSADAQGLPAIRAFLEDIVTHHASLLTQHRRGRYWQSVSFSAASMPDGVSGWQPARRQPAADTSVMLGFVRSAEHLKWILTQRRYNLRLGNRRGSVGLDGIQANAELLILYGEALPAPRIFALVPPPEVWLRANLEATGYPNPGGPAYLCLVLGDAVDTSQAGAQLDDRVRSVASSDGRPKLTTWAHVAVG